MEDWKERLVKEQVELKEKLIKLIDFINSEKFYELSANNKQVLNNQKIVMELYLSVLNMRVFENVDEIVVPDYGMMQVMGNAFNGSLFNFPKLDNVKCLKEKLKEEDFKATSVDKAPIIE